MIKQDIKINCGVTGKATLIFTNGDKKVFKNTVTNIGLSEIVYSLLDKSMQPLYFAVGSSDANITPAQVALQTALTAEILRVSALSISVDQDQDLNYEYHVENEFGQEHGDNLSGQTIREVGLFNRYASGEMFARAQTDAPFTMDDNSLLISRWDIKINVQDMATSGGIVLSGSKLVCESLMKTQKEVNAEQYGGGEQDIRYTPCPWGINLISFGINDSQGSIRDIDLKEPQKDYDAPPTITSLDLTGEGSDVNYEAKIIIQKYIPANSIPFDIKEVGLFNNRDLRFGNPTSALVTNIRTMFSRVVLPVVILANAEAVLTFTIGFRRGA